jgi:23S rRNA pseudouridine1911/1915/1917 synthase
MAKVHRQSPRPAILHLDDHLLIVDKPAGVLSVPGRGDQPCIADLLRGQDGLSESEPFWSVHRLDRDASGVIVFARTPEAERRLTEQFADRSVEKVYIALVRGLVAEDGEVSLPLKYNDDHTRAEIAMAGGKPSRTLYSVVETVTAHTLLECRPLTGRLHQIRVHLAAIGHPLGVDPFYGGAEAIYLSTYKSDYRTSRKHEERPLIARLTLHAARIALDHPAGAGRVMFSSPLPKDFRATLSQLRRL